MIQKGEMKIILKLYVVINLVSSFQINFRCTVIVLVLITVFGIQMDITAEILKYWVKL